MCRNGLKINILSCLKMNIISFLHKYFPEKAERRTAKIIKQAKKDLKNIR